MTIAADPRYRSVRLDFNNNDPRGNELIQLYAKISGGDWALARTFAVGGAEQLTSWDTALPVAAYNIAMRYVSGNVPAVGYEGSPDDWTAPTAAGSKSTVTTTSAAVAWVGATPFVNSSTPINLTWASDQQDAPYLLEKSTNGGMSYVNVAADLVAKSYQYTIPPGELNTTVIFRVTAQRGGIVGPTAGTLSVPMFITVGATSWTSATFNPLTRTAALVWTAASNATSYLLEKNPGSGWVTVATVGATSYNYPVPDGEINTTVNFRVTGKNGTTSGATSSAQPLAMTLAVGQPTLGSPSFNATTGVVALAWTSASNATSYLVEKDTGSGFVTITTVGGTSYNYTIQPSEANTTVAFRVTGQNGSISGTPSGSQSVALTITIGATTLNTPVWNPTTSPTGTTYGTISLSWSAASNASTYLVERSLNGGGSWATVTTTSGTATNVNVSGSDVNTATQFRVTPNNTIIGAGTVSNTESVTTTFTIGSPTINLTYYVDIGGQKRVQIDYTFGTNSYTTSVDQNLNNGNGYFGLYDPIVFSPTSVSANVSFYTGMNVTFRVRSFFGGSLYVTEVTQSMVIP